ncbi:hypothetical protein QTP88_009202 [Uroleucon formosanum]
MSSDDDDEKTSSLRPRTIIMVRAAAYDGPFDDCHIRSFLINNGSVKDNNMKQIGLSVEYGRLSLVSPFGRSFGFYLSSSVKLSTFRFSNFVPSAEVAEKGLFSMTIV